MAVNQVRDCGRVERMKNGADDENADGEVLRARIKLDVTRKKENGEKIKRNTEAENALRRLGGCESDMELGHWVTGSMGHLGHLSGPGHRVTGSSF